MPKQGFSFMGNVSASVRSFFLFFGGGGWVNCQYEYIFLVFMC